MEDVGVWGLVEVPYRNPNTGAVQYNSGFYAMMQFSKYIKRGKIQERIVYNMNVIKTILFTVDPRYVLF